jgi:hypothetical protein
MRRLMQEQETLVTVPFAAWRLARTDRNPNDAIE